MQSILEILGKVGFDWQVALANLVNFLIIFFILKHFAFKPVKKILKARQDKINQGLLMAQEAQVRLKEVDQIAKSKLKEADANALAIVGKAKERAVALDGDLNLQLEEKRKELMRRIEQEYENSKELSRQKIFKESVDLVREFIVKTVELKPESIDNALIAKAISKVKDYED